jgi:hypothetical protein
MEKCKIVSDSANIPTFCEALVFRLETDVDKICKSY